jgi:RimJ/RimL family protein N-acetyltransferase
MVFMDALMTTQPLIHSLQDATITLLRIHASNSAGLRSMLLANGAPESMLADFDRSYQPRFDPSGRLTKFGFCTFMDGQLVGLSLLGVRDWTVPCGYTGADTLPAYRGRGIAPASKPHLFYLGFALLGLTRIETGCAVSNRASQRSIEKTAGFVYEGRVSKDPPAEDEFRYAIMRERWAALYADHVIAVTYRSRESPESLDPLT